MNETIVTSGWEAILWALPLMGILAMSLFRIDELLTMRKGSVENHRGFCTLDADGEPLLFDPDGRACKVEPKGPHRTVAQLIHPLPVSLYRGLMGGRSSDRPKRQPFPKRRCIHMVKR